MSFHSKLASKGKGTKDWANSWTEVEHLGDGAFRASLTSGHRVFRDKADNKWKKRKLTDNRPDHVVIQGARCCVEVHTDYATYFDVHHEEVRVEKERWIVQRLFKEPDTWRDMDAYNPVMDVEESEADGLIKVSVSYDTDYGPLVLEYIQIDGKTLKHNITFTNSSGSSEVFRVIQRWMGISSDKVNGRKINDKKRTNDVIHIFGDEENSFKIQESGHGLMGQGIKDTLDMFTGSREAVSEENVLVERENVKLSTRGHSVNLRINNELVMINSSREISITVLAVEECPDNARVFIGGLGLGVILLHLLHSRKAVEIIVCEENQVIIDELAPLIRSYLTGRFPNLNLTIIQGDAAVEVANHGKFDWIFMDFFFMDELSREAETWLMGLSLPHLTDRGVYTSYVDIAHLPLRRVPYLRNAEIDIHPNGLKSDFIYGDWILSDGRSLEIDPDTATLSNPTEDGDVTKNGVDAAACGAAAVTRDNIDSGFFFGGTSNRGGFWGFRGYVEWPIGTLAGATVTDTVFKYEGRSIGATDGEINPLTEGAPSAVTDANLWAYIATGVAYVDPFTVVVAANQSEDLGAACDTDLQTAIDASQSWFAIGFQSAADECQSENRESSIWTEEYVGPPVPPPTLEVTYTPAAAVGFQPGHLRMTLGLGRMGYDLKTRGGRARRRVG